MRFALLLLFAGLAMGAQAQPYPCPDLFEGHIFSCPTVPAMGVGLDSDTDAIVVGVELSCHQGSGGICVAPRIEYGRGSQDFGDLDPTTGEPLSYSVLQLGVHGHYSVAINQGGSLTAYPLVGPAYYRFSYSDCPFADGCTENIFLVDLGGGVQYGNFGLQAFTGLGGPTLRFRVKYTIAQL